MILAELQRLSSHIIWLATHALDIGAMTPFFYTFEEREKILDLFEEYCGARLTLELHADRRPAVRPARRDGSSVAARFIEQLPAKIDD